MLSNGLIVVLICCQRLPYGREEVTANNRKPQFVAGHDQKNFQETSNDTPLLKLAGISDNGIIKYYGSAVFDNYFTKHDIFQDIRKRKAPKFLEQ